MARTSRPLGGSSSLEQVYNFRVGESDASLESFTCRAWSDEEAVGKARAMGHRKVTLVGRHPTDDRRLAIQRLEVNPNLGPQWLPLVETIEMVMQQVLFGSPWTLSVHSREHAFYPGASPGLHCVQRLDGSLYVELTGPTELHFARHNDLDLLGWTLGNAGDRALAPANPTRLFDAGWSAADVAVTCLLTLTTLYALHPDDLFDFGEEVADEVAAVGLLDRLGAGPQFKLTTDRLAPVTAFRPLTTAVRGGSSSMSDARALERLVNAARLTPIFHRYLEEIYMDLAWNHGANDRISDWNDVEKRVDDLLAESGELDLAESVFGRMTRYAMGDFAGAYMRAAVRGLLARRHIASGKLTLSDYETLTAPWAAFVGKVHPDDSDRLLPSSGPRTSEILDLVLAIDELTPRQKALLEPAHTAGHSNVEQARNRGEDITRRLRLLRYVQRSWGEDREEENLVHTDAVLALTLRYPPTGRSLISPEDYVALSCGWTTVVGPLIEGDRRPTPPVQPAVSRRIDGIERRAATLDSRQLEELDEWCGLLGEDLRLARDATWRELWPQGGAHPWGSGLDLHPQGAADAADALLLMTLGGVRSDDWRCQVLLSGWRRVVGLVPA